jgi:hypothetical protein
MVRYPTPAGARPTKGAMNMRKIALSLAVLAAILLPALYAAPAHATPLQVWVSHGGSDANLCLATQPCLTIARALTQTSGGGEVSCLDAGGFGGGFTITFTVTINCSETMARNAFSDGSVVCGNGITINAPGIIVALRGLDLNGFYSKGCTLNGILIQAAGAVFIEDCVIENWQQKGILDQRTTGFTQLTIKNTIVRGNASAGIVAAAAPKNSVVLENVHSVGNTFGLAVATGNNVVINRSIFSENGVAGIEADPGATVFVDNSVISHNVSYGVYALGTVGLANSDISLNSSSISGTTMSYGNNRMFMNGAGTAPTPVGATSTDFGQQ